MNAVRILPVAKTARRLRYARERLDKFRRRSEEAESPYLRLILEREDIQSRWQAIFKSAEIAFQEHNAKKIMQDFPTDWRRYQRLTEDWEAVLAQPGNNIERLRSLEAKAQDIVLDATQDYQQSLQDAFLSPAGLRVATVDKKDTYTHVGIWTRSGANLYGARLGRPLEQYGALCGKQIHWSFSSLELVACEECLRLLDEATWETRLTRAQRQSGE